MEAYQERLLEEKFGLDRKIAKLGAFIECDYFAVTVSQDERCDLELQLHAMRCYSLVLGRRISRMSVISSYEDEAAG